MNRAAYVLGVVLILSVSLFVSGFGYALHLAKIRGYDEAAFRHQFGNVNVSSPVYSFSPPVPMYWALKIDLEGRHWTASSLVNMTVSVSLDYYRFIYDEKIVNGNQTAHHFSAQKMYEVTESAASYMPVVIQNENNNGTTTYRYVWTIAFMRTEPHLFPMTSWVDAATAEIVETGIIT